MNINSQNLEPFESTQGKHSALEADIERLSKEIAEKRNLPEHKGISERELLKQALQPIIKPQPTAQEPAISNQQSAISNKILPEYLKDFPAETKLQVEQLIDLTFHQGIEKVVVRARRASPFILDAFHDALADKLYEELKNRKLI